MRPVDVDAECAAFAEQLAAPVDERELRPATMRGQLSELGRDADALGALLLAALTATLGPVLRWLERKLS